MAVSRHYQKFNKSSLLYHIISIFVIICRDKQETVEPEVTDERLKHIDPKMIELIESEIIDKGTPIG